tara:strand:+ start:310 stop:507 length:198 start_codon:yes stop_codon:yes gene_type:complete
MEYSNFDDYLESEYTQIDSSEYYECNGAHIWHITNIQEEYWRLRKAPSRTFNHYEKMLYKCGVEL